MIAVIALGALSLWAVIATIECVSRDGYRQVPVRSPAQQFHCDRQPN